MPRRRGLPWLPRHSAALGDQRIVPSMPCTTRAKARCCAGGAATDTAVELGIATPAPTSTSWRCRGGRAPLWVVSYGRSACNIRRYRRRARRAAASHPGARGGGREGGAAHRRGGRRRLPRFGRTLQGAPPRLVLRVQVASRPRRQPLGRRLLGHPRRLGQLPRLAFVLELGVGDGDVWRQARPGRDVVDGGHAKWRPQWRARHHFRSDAMSTRRAQRTSSRRFTAVLCPDPRRPKARLR